MGNRLSKIVTKTGDNGTSGLGDGSRLSKTHVRFDAIGDIDELNCQVGLILANSQDIYDLYQIDLLQKIQHKLFDVGAELSIPNYVILAEHDVEELEEMIDMVNDFLPPLKNFIIPGGSQLVCLIHQARAISRRAERNVWRLNEISQVNAYTRIFLNRLSDYFFVLARYVDPKHEVLWQPKKRDE